MEGEQVVPWEVSARDRTEGTRRPHELLAISELRSALAEIDRLRAEARRLRELLDDVDYEARQYQPAVPETHSLSAGLLGRIHAALAEVTP